MSRRHLALFALTSMVVACGPSNPATSIHPHQLGGTIVGATPSDLWSVLVTGSTVAIDHYDGGSWHTTTLPGSLSTVRTPVGIVSGGARGVWISMPASDANQPFTLVRLTSDGTADDHSSELPMATGGTDQIALFGRDGAVVVQVVQTTGSALLFRYDGSHFVAVPAIPSSLAEVVCASGGTDIWARAPMPGAPEEQHFRFDGTAWQTISGNTIPTTGAWSAAAPDNVWGTSVMPGSPVIHWDGQQFTTVMLPREADAAGGMANQVDASVLAGVVAGSHGHGVDVLLHTQVDAMGFTHADLQYRSLVGSVIGERRTFRLALENDAQQTHGFHGGFAGVATLDDGSIAVSMNESTNSAMDGFLYVAGSDALH